MWLNSRRLSIPGKVPSSSLSPRFHQSAACCRSTALTLNATDHVTHSLLFRKIYILRTLLILISTGAGVIYAVVKSDPGTGLSISSYILTFLSLILAVVVAGEWLGLTKPDSFSFAYDWVENRVVSKEDFGRLTGGRW